jgi:hypothetical protein
MKPAAEDDPVQLMNALPCLSTSTGPRGLNGEACQSILPLLASSTWTSVCTSAYTNEPSSANDEYVPEAVAVESTEYLLRPIILVDRTIVR